MFCGKDGIKASQIVLYFIEQPSSGILSRSQTEKMLIELLEADMTVTHTVTLKENKCKNDAVKFVV